MSIRIHSIATELGISAKELLCFVQERLDAYDNIVVKSASSGIMPIYADMIKADYIKYKKCQSSEEAKAKPVELKEQAAEIKAKPEKEKTVMQAIKGFVSSLLPSKKNKTTIVLVDKSGKSLSVDKYLRKRNVTQALFYVDTNCFCRFKTYEETFEKIIESSKERDKSYKPFCILHAIINELERLKTKPKTEKIVESALKLIKDMNPYISFKGNKNESFADNLILSDIMSNIVKKDIILFSEDKALVKDILGLNLNSTQSKYKIFVAKAV